MAKPLSTVTRRRGRWGAGGAVNAFRSPWCALRTILAFLQISLALLLSAAVGITLGAFAGVVKTLPVDPSLADFAPKAATVIYSSEGQLLGKVWVEKREPVPISEIPPDLQLALVATEDKRFFHHHGVDLQGILRAAKANLVQGKLVEGGSTITQQLARDLYLSRKKTLTRKVKEAILAVEIERRYSKQEILELYLNQVNFGHAAYGVNCAAHLYFGKDLKDLTLGECALLAGLPRRPSYYSPYNNPGVARRRRDYVLSRMLGRRYITERQMRAAMREPITLAGEKPRLWEQLQAPYFTSYVVQELVKRYGEKKVYEGGLRVFTSLQMPVQKAAEEAVQAQISRLARLRASQGALVAIHPQTGYIVAMVGGMDYGESEFNRAAQARRQPGSSFKPFVYATAIGQGMSPSSSINAQARNIGGWVCKNSGGGQYGVVTLLTGLSKSINTAAVNLQQRVGTENVIRTARAMGIESPLLPVDSLAVGTNEVTLLEMTSAFGVFPADGIRYEPQAVTRVEDYRGMVLDVFPPHPRRALATKTAQTMRKMLQSVIRGGTGTRAGGVNPEAGGKTGTTDDYKDVWFFGFVPNLVAGVWAGNDDHSPTAHLFGGTACAPTWKAFMLQALKGFAPPASVGAALGEEGAVQYDLSERRRDKAVRKEKPVPVEPAATAPTEETAPRKASTAPSKGELEPVGTGGLVRPGLAGTKGEPGKVPSANAPDSALERGRGRSSVGPAKVSTKATEQ